MGPSSRTSRHQSVLEAVLCQGCTSADETQVPVGVRGVYYSVGHCSLHHSSKPGQGGIGDQDKRRDLRLELNKAEEEANEKKRKAQGLSLEDIGQGTDDSQQKIPKLIDNPGEGDAHAEPSTRTHESQASEDKPQTLDKDEEADDDERWVAHLSVLYRLT